MPFPRHSRPTFKSDPALTGAILREFARCAEPQTAGQIRAAVGADIQHFYPALDELTAQGVLASEFYASPRPGRRTYTLAEAA